MHSSLAIHILRRVAKGLNINTLESFPIPDHDPESFHLLQHSDRLLAVALNSQTLDKPTLSGFVSSNRISMRPLLAAAISWFRMRALAWPMCRKPEGSGGKRVTTLPDHSGPSPMSKLASAAQAVCWNKSHVILEGSCRKAVRLDKALQEHEVKASETD